MSSLLLFPISINSLKSAYFNWGRFLHSFINIMNIINDEWQSCQVKWSTGSVFIKLWPFILSFVSMVFHFDELLQSTNTLFLQEKSHQLFHLFSTKWWRGGFQTLFDHLTSTSDWVYWLLKTVKIKWVHWWISLPCKTKNPGSSSTSFQYMSEI